MRCRPLLLVLFCTRAWSQPASLAGFSDEGAFILYANEERLGRLTFQWKANGSFESRMSMAFAGQTTSSTVSLTPDTEGRWTKAVLEDPSSRTTWTRDGQDITFTSPERTLHGRWPENSLTFETWTPPLFTQALRRFDGKGEDTQNIPIIVLNGDLPEDPNLTVERKATVERTVNGRRLRLTNWVYSPAGHEYHVLADQEGLVYWASGFTHFGGGTGEQHGVFVREGFEGLLEKSADAKFEVEVKAGVRIAMRDGVKLATDLYMPAGAAKAPVILIRTPYKKEMEELRGRFYARRGYVVAVQDVRGRFSSEGVWEPLVHEAKDGYDAIEWLARQPWCTGKVGMIGASYLGWVQWMAASTHPPHLAALIPNVSPPDPFRNFPFDYGIPGLVITLKWADMVQTNATGELSGATIGKLRQKDYGELVKHLPLTGLDKSVLGADSAYWQLWMRHSVPDRYWADTMFLEKLKDVRLPVFHQSGWFDGDGIGSKLNYLKMAEYGHANQKLTIGPWGHDDTATRLSQKRDFGGEAAIDLQADYLRWFDRWLKGIDNGIEREPLVSLFVMGPNKWVHGAAYPLTKTRFEKLYLSGGGKLTFQQPAGEQRADHYTYDPGNPTPDVRGDDTRKDLLVYTTAPFEKPYTMAGPVSAVLYAASSARDTDWFVHMFDVDEKGGLTPLWSNGSQGHIRARYRNSLTKAELLKPGETYKYSLDLWHTGVTIPTGHRLRVEVSSASFPGFARNLNTGGNNETETRFVAAEQSIYHDARHASYILLPAIPEE
jgi:putative CocE/NonD family hydrolase